MDKPAFWEEGILLTIGAVARGDQGRRIIRDFEEIKLSRLRIQLAALALVGGADLLPEEARPKGIRIYSDPQELLTQEHLDVILEFTGDRSVLADLAAQKPETVGLLDQKSSFLFLDIAQLYDLMGARDTEITLAKSFATTLLEASPDGVLVLDREYRIINSNDSPLVTGGKSRQDILGRYCFEVMRQQPTICRDREACCAIEETIRTGKPARKVHDRLMPDGTTRVCQITAYPIYNRFQEMLQFVITVRDMTQEISERILLQTEVIKKDLTRVVKEDRLASLGRLVASVCHEINNPITSIVTFTKLILSYLREGKNKALPKEAERYLEVSFREALRCGGIVKNLLTFARQDNLEASHIDIKEMLNTIMLLTSHQLELAKISWQVNLPPGRFEAWGDFGQIQQCLLNLIFNAIEAMPSGGTLVIEGVEEADQEMIRIDVRDTGLGIDPEHLQHIFEPFFTTKTGGKGVGLGLAMVYGIIREHRGTIEVDSTPGRGTTFSIRLPKHPLEGHKGAAV
jgi:PAS domain S-box-containing protein